MIEILIAYNLLRQLRDGVDRLPVVGGVGNAKRKGELVALDQPLPEVVPLDHREVLHRFAPNRKRQARSHRLQLEKLRPEMVPNQSCFVLLRLGKLI